MIEKGSRFQDLCRKDSSKARITFGESELNPDWQVWVKVLGLIQETETLILVGSTTYEHSPTLTWLHIFAKVLNVSYRRENPMKIIVKKA